MNNKLLSIKHGKGTKKKHTDKFFSYFYRHFRYIIGQQWCIKRYFILMVVQQKGRQPWIRCRPPEILRLRNSYAFTVNKPLLFESHAGLNAGNNLLLTLGHKDDDLHILRYGCQIAYDCRQGVCVGLVETRTLCGGTDGLAPLAGQHVMEHVLMAIGVKIGRIDIVLCVIERTAEIALGANDVVLHQNHIQFVGRRSTVAGVIASHINCQDPRIAVDGGTCGQINAGSLTGNLADV